MPLGAELPLPVLTGGAHGLSMALKVANSGQAPIRGSLQRYNPNYNHWEEVVSDVVGTGGSLHFDMENGLPLGVPLKLVVTTDVGQFLHLDNMSCGRYQSDHVYDEEVSVGGHSAYAGSVNLPLAPLPAELTLASGATSVSLNVSNDVSADMGVELSLPLGMLMPMRSVEDESIHCVPISRTRYKNVRVPLSTAAVIDVFATATLLPAPVSTGGGVIFQNGPGNIDLNAEDGPVIMGTEFPLLVLSGDAVEVNFSFYADAKEESSIRAVLQSYDAGHSKWEGGGTDGH